MPSIERFYNDLLLLSFDMLSSLLAHMHMLSSAQLVTECSAVLRPWLECNRQIEFNPDCRPNCTSIGIGIGRVGPRARRSHAWSAAGRPEQLDSQPAQPAQQRYVVEAMAPQQQACLVRSCRR